MTTATEAVILAAGRGVRLGNGGEDLPKPLLPIGPRSAEDPTPMSFLRRQVELLHERGVSPIVVVVGHRGTEVAAAVETWAPWVRIAVNTTPDIQTSGSLHSFQFAARSGHGVLDGTRKTLLMDADIVYHRDVLSRILEAPAGTTTLVCEGGPRDEEQVLVYGASGKPRFLGKGLTPELVEEQPCLGEATGIVKLAPDDHLLARHAMAWLLGDPDAPAGSARAIGFGAARRATEHEVLSQWLMHRQRMASVRFSVQDLPFMECDTAPEYEVLRTELYPRVVEMEAQ